MCMTIDSEPHFRWPSIIQGGMGAGVSNWKLARAVSSAGQLGVVSGTALDTIMIRRLQDGDLDGAMRRAFACSDESGIIREIKEEIIEQYRSGQLNVITDFRASPTDYPFKRVDVKANAGVDACRACDLGYLRHFFEKQDGTLACRCPASPRKVYLAKGGQADDCEGRRCLCNELMATIGMGQVRRGRFVQPLVTMGEDLSFLDKMEVSDAGLPTARSIVDFLLS